MGVVLLTLGICEPPLARPAEPETVVVVGTYARHQDLMTAL